MKTPQVLLVSCILALGMTTSTKAVDFGQLSDYLYDYEVLIANPYYPTGLWYSIGVFDTYDEAVSWRDAMEATGWDTRIERIYTRQSIRWSTFDQGTSRYDW